MDDVFKLFGESLIKGLCKDEAKFRDTKRQMVQYLELTIVRSLKLEG